MNTIKGTRRSLLNRRRIKMAQSAIFSSRFVTDNHLTRHALRAVLNVHRFNPILDEGMRVMVP
jgi:hypothetical protein